MKKIFLYIIIAFLMTGCTFETNPDALMSAPKVGGVEGDVVTLLTEHLPDGASLLPVEGSAVHYEDLNGDSVVEALGFYYDLNDEMPLKIVYFTLLENEWQIQDTVGLSGSNFEEIYFDDLDHNGHKEMLLGINFMGNNSKGLIIYQDVNNNLTDLFRKEYVELVIEDMDGDHMEDLILITSSRETGIAKATLYNMIAGDLTYLSEASMTPFVSYGEMTIGQASENELGLFIEGSLDSRTSITELLIKRNNRLINVFSNPLKTTIKSRPALHKDIDGDGVIDIAMDYPSIGYEDEEEAERINQWYTWDGEDGLMDNHRSYDNITVDVSFIYPDNWGDGIKVTANTENEDDLYYAMSHYKSKKSETLLFSIHNVSAWIFQDMKTAEGVYKITEKGNRVYLLKVEEKNDSPYYLEADEILEQLTY